MGIATQLITHHIILSKFTNWPKLHQIANTLTMLVSFEQLVKIANLRDVRQSDRLINTDFTDILGVIPEKRKGRALSSSHVSGLTHVSRTSTV